MERNLLLKVLMDVKKNLSKLGGIRDAKVITESDEVDEGTVVRMVELKNQIDSLKAELDGLNKEYDEYRTKLLGQLPGEAIDTVNLTVRGVLIKKFAKNASNRVNEERLLEVMKRKKLLNKLTERRYTRVILEDKYLEAVAEGLITYDEVESCIDQKPVPVLTMKVVDPYQLTLLEDAQGVVSEGQDQDAV